MSTSTTIYEPATGIAQLESLNAAWARNTAGCFPNLLPTLAVKQSPQILWIGCSDSRVPETSLLGLLPGEVFVHRNIANMVNPDDISFPAVLTYAVEHVGVRMIIVCGHLGCGGVAGACVASVNIPEVDRWLTPLRALRTAHMGALSGMTDSGQQAALVKLNVAQSVTQLSKYPMVAAAVAKGDLQVHGAIYNLASGLVGFLSPTDVADPGPPVGLDHNFRTDQVYHLYNYVCGPGVMLDVRDAAHNVKCNGADGGYPGYPNEAFFFTPTGDGAVTFGTIGTGTLVATVNPTTLLLTMAAPLLDGTANTQHFRPRADPTRPNWWSFTCDYLPAAFKLTGDAATANALMSSNPGSGAMWYFWAGGPKPITQNAVGVVENAPVNHSKRSQ